MEIINGTAWQVLTGPGDKFCFAVAATVPRKAGTDAQQWREYTRLVAEAYSV